MHCLATSRSSLIVCFWKLSRTSLVKDFVCCKRYIFTSLVNVDCIKTDDPDTFGTYLQPNINKGKYRIQDKYTEHSKQNHVTKKFSERRINVNDNKLKSIITNWKHLKHEEGEKLVLSSKNLLEEENEEEYCFYGKENINEYSHEINEGNHECRKLNNAFSVNTLRKNKQSLDNGSLENVNKGTLRNNVHSLADDYFETVNESTLRNNKQSLADDSFENVNKFGTISSTKNHLEHKEDDGDVKEEQYLASRLERRDRPQFYGQKIKQLCKEKKFAEALLVLEQEMPSVGAKPNGFCFQVLINECGRLGYTKKAFMLYNNMKKRGIRPEPVAFTGLFNACANSPWLLTDGLTRARKLRQQLIESNFVFNQTVSHAMIKAFGRCGDIATAFKIIDEMIIEGLNINTETINHLLQSCITDHQAGFRHALMVWWKMRKLNMKPDIYSYNLFIRCIKDCCAGDPKLISQLLLVPGSSEIKPKCIENKSNSNKEVILIEGVNIQDKKSSSSKENIDNSVTNKLYSKEIDEKKSVDKISNEMYSAMYSRPEIKNKELKTNQFPNLLAKQPKLGDVIGLTSLNKPEERLTLVGGLIGLMDQMQKDNVTANIKSFTMLLDSLPSEAWIEEALMKSMESVEVTPDTSFCNMLIRKRSFRHDIKGANGVLDVMQKHHLLPDLITFGCLALGCQWKEDAQQLLSDMDQMGFRPNVEIMSTLVKNSVHKQDVYFCREMVLALHKREIKPNKQILTDLEKTRKVCRSTIIQLERQKNLDIKSKKIFDVMRLFLFDYKNWLQTIEMEEEDHPWAQYTLPQTKKNLNKNC